jgi:hypothetical protein
MTGSPAVSMLGYYKGLIETEGEPIGSGTERRRGTKNSKN